MDCSRKAHPPPKTGVTCNKTSARGFEARRPPPPPAPGPPRVPPPGPRHQNPFPPHRPFESPRVAPGPAANSQAFPPPPVLLFGRRGGQNPERKPDGFSTRPPPLPPAFVARQLMTRENKKNQKNPPGARPKRPPKAQPDHSPIRPQAPRNPGPFREPNRQKIKAQPEFLVPKPPPRGAAPGKRENSLGAPRPKPAVNKPTAGKKKPSPGPRGPGPPFLRGGPTKVPPTGPNPPGPGQPTSPHGISGGCGNSRPRGPPPPWRPAPCPAPDERGARGGPGGAGCGTGHREPNKAKSRPSPGPPPPPPHPRDEARWRM